MEYTDIRTNLTFDFWQSIAFLVHSLQFFLIGGRSDSFNISRSGLIKCWRHYFFFVINDTRKRKSLKTWQRVSATTLSLPDTCLISVVNCPTKSRCRNNWRVDALSEPFRNAKVKGLKITKFRPFTKCIENNSRSKALHLFSPSDNFLKIVPMVSNHFQWIVAIQYQPPIRELQPSKIIQSKEMDERKQRNINKRLFTILERLDCLIIPLYGSFVPFFWHVLEKKRIRWASSGFHHDFESVYIQNSLNSIRMRMLEECLLRLNGREHLQQDDLLAEKNPFKIF